MFFTRGSFKGHGGCFCVYKGVGERRIKAARDKAVIAQLRTEGGGMVSDPKGMVEAASSFYQESFREKDIDGSKESVFLGFLREKVHPDAASDLDRPFELEEVEAALRGLPANKVPGYDGIPCEFYLLPLPHLLEILGRDFLSVIKAVYDSGLLGSSMREGVLTLLYKKGERDNMGNYRPITLLCADYKVVAHVLAGRLRKVLPHVIHEDQTCGVEGRSIHWNLSLVRDCIAWAQDRGVHLMLVGLDMEKAFDKVHHGFLFSVLDRMGFGAGFLRWVGILYTAVGSRVLVNGHVGEVVPQQTGVRQGCPLSPLLFVLYMEPLAAAIRADVRIKGLRPPGGGSSEVKISQYADDMTLFLTSEGSASGARVNLGKSSVKFFGPWAGREEGLSGLPLCSGPMRVLGVDFEVTGSEGINWGQRIAKVRTRVGLWKARRLSMSGRVLVIKADILPSLVYLAYVFPLPPRYRKDLVRTLFSFVWGGYEYVKRDWMVQSVEEGGRGVPDLPLKLDTIFFSSICKSLVNPCNHGFKAFVLAILPSAKVDSMGKLPT
uniref:Reverse transcriptase domain-containing protein n=1 Tax=Oncorhynchus mykiss TaxID=8022 RepID=A0A8K9Y2W7_ONCMY